MFFKLSKEILKGKSLSRSLVNLELMNENISVSGKTLDLGGQSLYWCDGQPRGASYMRFLKFKEAEILKLDINEQFKPEYVIDFEKDKLPFDNNSVDNVLAFNLFEHIFNYNFLGREIFRVLKPGGQVIGSVPFLLRIHPDPNDFFRYSNQALEQIFREIGFSKIEIKDVGFGPFVSQYSQVEFVLPKALRLLLSHSSIWLDKVFLRLKPKFKGRFPLDYIFILKK